MIVQCENIQWRQIGYALPYLLPIINKKATELLEIDLTLIFINRPELIII